MKYLKTFFSAFLNFVIFIVFLCIIPICFVPYFIGEETFWGTMGDYIGGIIGTIAALLVLMATREIINLQKKELKETRKEFKKQSAIFNQQQFEETFFSLIKLLGEKQLVPTEKNNENKDYHIVYGLIKEIIAMIKNYRSECINENMPEEEKEKKEHNECIKEDMSKEEKEHIENEIKHYINILKLQVKDETHLYLLDRIMNYNEEELKKYFKEHHFCEFMDIAIIVKDIEKYEKYFGKDIFGDNKDFLIRKSEYTGLEAEEYQKLYRPDGKNIAKDIAILKNLSKNMAPKMPENILIELAQNHQQELTEEDKKEIRQNVANNRNAPAKALEILSTDNEENIRKAVAAHQNTDKEVLKKLATEDECTSVREVVAKNPQITTDILNNLSQDDNRSVRLAVAQNEKTLSNTLQYLAERDKYDCEICLEIVRHNNTSSETLHYLSQNTNEKVRLEVAKDKRTLSKTFNYLSKDRDYQVRLEVAKNTHTPKNTLAHLYASKKSTDKIKEEIAQNTNTPQQILYKLSKINQRIAYMVIKNPSTSAEVIEKMYVDKSILPEIYYNLMFLLAKNIRLSTFKQIVITRLNGDKNINDATFEFILGNKKFIHSERKFIVKIIKQMTEEIDNFYSNYENIFSIMKLLSDEENKDIIEFVLGKINKNNPNTDKIRILRTFIDYDNPIFTQEYLININNRISQVQSSSSIWRDLKQLIDKKLQS